jgi:hypothetical protein
MPRNPSSESGRNAGTFLALIGLMAVAGALLALIAMVLPQVLGLFSVLFGFAIFAALQYVVWGYWLSRSMHPPAEDRPDSAGPPRGAGRDG